MRVATLTNKNNGIGSSISSLPLNATTNVRVEAVGREVLLFLNNTFDSKIIVSADRIFGEAFLYASDPRYTPASASIGSIQMKSISSLSVSIAKDFSGLLTKLAVYEATIVPANFALSFDLKPFGIDSSMTSILTYTNYIHPRSIGGFPGMTLAYTNY